ncbi:MAG: hydroxyethylthiazole kinase [Armatimonadota bacterium]|nr:hydroxyethylthiazole kinase [Armatimonadota bacterium]MDR5697451.1 hydroxyethylthiazole kinase [Armatimonadota bacterium]
MRADRVPVGPLPAELAELASEWLARVRERRPLVHHITNFVAMNDTANVTLAVGALPVMAHAREEVEDMTALASALVLNIGTLTPAWVESMLVAGRCANRNGIPVVLDPVGVGATPLRTASALRILDQVEVGVVRGNLGEMSHLVGVDAEVRGVESVAAAAAPDVVARRVADNHGVVAAVTGARDWVAGPGRLLAVDNGHPMLQRITGTGCMATTVIACFVAVVDDAASAAAAGLAYFGYAAEVAASRATGPGSFRAALLDCLAALSPGDVRRGVRVQEKAQSATPGRKEDGGP